MSRMRRRAAFRAVVLSGVVAAATVATACGDDEDGGESADVQQVQITASSSPSSPTLDLDKTEIESGATEITLQNDTDGPADGQLVFVAAGEDRSDEDVIGQLTNAFEGRPVADWFQGGGGPGRVGPGETSSVTQDLQPGTYYVLAVEDLPKPPLTKLEVRDGDGAALPETDGSVSAVEYAFTGEGLQAGTNRILLSNDGAQWHHFLASKLRQGGTIDQARAFLGGDGRGVPNPFEEKNLEENAAIESTIMEGGVSQVVEADLQPGRYAFFCFISDKQGGPPHVAKGMVSEVTVAE